MTTAVSIAGAVHDITEFLARHEPFDELDEQTLAQIANSTEVEYFPRGEVIFPQSAGPLEHVRMIRRGAVELLDGDEVLDELREGDLFGHPSMLTGLPTAFTARAAEDSLCYRMPAAEITPLLTRPGGIRFLAREMRHREALRARAPLATAARLADRPAHQLVRSRYVETSPDSSIAETARRMVEAEVSCAIVRLPQGHGIVTDRDLRARVVAVGRSLDAPVETIMTTPAIAVDPGQPASEVTFTMLENGIRHVPVIDARGNLVGIIRDIDLLASEESHPLSLRREVQSARSVEELRKVASRLPSVLVGLGDAALPGGSVSRIHATIADAVVMRMIELAAGAEAELKVLPIWIATGSHGRRELAPASDLDSGLTWPAEVDAESEGAIRALGSTVTLALADLQGLYPDPNGETAASSLFARSRPGWRDLVSRWAAKPEMDKVPIFLSAVLDGRALGDPEWSGEMLAEMSGDRVRDELARWLLRLALDRIGDRGSMRVRLLEPVRARGGAINLKDALQPIVDLARYGGFVAGSGLLATPGRLRAAGAAGVINPADAELLAEAHEWFTDLRVSRQLQQLREGRAPTDLVSADALGTLNRAYMNDAFRLIHGVRRRMHERL